MFDKNMDDAGGRNNAYTSFDGLDRDEVDQFYSRVDAVTLQQANSVVQKDYKTNNLMLNLLRDAAKSGRGEEVRSSDRARRSHARLENELPRNF